MIRQIQTSDVPEATPQTAPSKVDAATAAGKSFASVLHAKTTAATGDGGAGSSSNSTGTSTATHHASAHHGPDKTPISAPEGEVWRPVAGHDHYAKIVEGPRAGQYINLSRGARRGQVFHIEARNGKRVHVYGSGASEVVVQAAKDSGKVTDHVVTTATQRRGKGEEWAPVKGVSNYADILSGSRNGYFVNTSGGVRDGMAFQIVKHGDKTFHVYGKGKHQQVIEVATPKKTTSSTAADGTTGTTTSTTGSTGATTDGTSTGGASAN